MKPSRRSRGALVTATAVALTLAWLIQGRPVPIYDGIGNPDEPYRYVRTPPGYPFRTKPATSAKTSVGLVNGAASVVELLTAESGPQAEVDILDQGLTVPAGSGAAAQSATVTLTPLAPDPGVPTPQIDGNIYELRWTAGAAPLSFANQGGDVILMRATIGPPPRAAFLYRSAPGLPWRALPTDQTGADVYSALLVGAGQYALTRHPSGDATGAAAHPHSRGSLPWTWILLAALLAVMAGFVVAVRLLRDRRPP